MADNANGHGVSSEPAAAPNCCSPEERNARISTFFNRRTERRGDKLPPLSPVSRSLLDVLAEDVLRGPMILELGSGTGALATELLRQGASQVTGVDLSSASVEAARGRVASAGFPEDRATFVAGDAAAVEVEPHDWVVLDRVICCYADVDRLLERAIGSAQKRIVYSIPESDGWRRPLHQFIWWIEDTWDTMRGNRPSPGYAHSVKRINASLRAGGFSPRREWRFRLWRLAVYDRTSSALRHD
jgi:SAM-dependent methyltransferase